MNLVLVLISHVGWPYDSGPTPIERQIKAPRSPFVFVNWSQDSRANKAKTRATILDPLAAGPPVPPLADAAADAYVALGSRLAKRTPLDRSSVVAVPVR